MELYIYEDEIYEDLEELSAEEQLDVISVIVPDDSDLEVAYVDNRTIKFYTELEVKEQIRENNTSIYRNIYKHFYNKGQIELLDTLKENLETAQIEGTPLIIPNCSLAEGCLLPSAKLELAKERKILELNRAKKLRQNLPVTVRDVEFCGGRSAAQKYDEALRLALKINALKEQATGEELIVEGVFGTYDGNNIVVDEQYANEIIVAVAGIAYQLWEKERGYINQVNNCTSILEVDNIKWED